MNISGSIGLSRIARWRCSIAVSLVIAVDQRGIELSDTPQSGYDSGTQANDLFALRETLGHEQGHGDAHCQEEQRERGTRWDWGEVG